MINKHMQRESALASYKQSCCECITWIRSSTLKSKSPNWRVIPSLQRKAAKLIKRSSSSLFCFNRKVQQQDKYYSKQIGDLKDQVKETEKARKN